MENFIIFTEQDVLDVGGEHLIPEELLQILEGGVPPGSSGAVAMAESLLERGRCLIQIYCSLSPSLLLQKIVCWIHWHLEPK